jgi:hypothetical protein
MRSWRVHGERIGRDCLSRQPFNAYYYLTRNPNLSTDLCRMSVYAIEYVRCESARLGCAPALALGRSPAARDRRDVLRRGRRVRAAYQRRGAPRLASAMLRTMMRSSAAHE